MKTLLLPLVFFLASHVQSNDQQINFHIHHTKIEKKFVPYSIQAPLTEGDLQVSPTHQIHYATYGNPQGIPVVVLHGGPGLGCNDDYSRFFDLNLWHVIMFDQRGAMRSIPFASMEENTTQNSVDDIEKLRTHMEIPQWVVFGHSWGSCLALVYGESHPESCLGFILEGIFLGRDKDIGFFKNMGKKSKTAYEDLLLNLTQEEQHDIPTACYQKLMNPDPTVHMSMARALMRYQLVNTDNPPTAEAIDQALSNDRFILSYIRAFVHYAIHQCFLKPNQVLVNLDKITHLPSIIVHGSEDTITVLEQALLLHENWEQSQLWVIEGAGHSCKEPAVANALVQATETFVLNMQESKVPTH